MFRRWRLVLIVFVAIILAVILAQGPMRSRRQADSVPQKEAREPKAQPNQAERKCLRRIQELGGTAFDGHLRTPVSLEGSEQQILAEFIIETDNSPKQAAFTVVLNGCHNMDEMLRQVVSLGNVEQLSLAESGVTDDLLRKVGILHSLRLLYLTDTAITDVGLSYLGGLNELEMLGVGETAVSDQGLKHLEKLESLKGLSLEGLPITDRGLSHIAELGSLVALSLNGTQITDEGLTYLSGLGSLRGLDVQNTRVTESGVRRLKEALPECNIAMGSTSKKRGEIGKRGIWGQSFISH